MVGTTLTFDFTLTSMLAVLFPFIHAALFRFFFGFVTFTVSGTVHPSEWTATIIMCHTILGIFAPEIAVFSVTAIFRLAALPCQVTYFLSWLATCLMKAYTCSIAVLFAILATHIIFGDAHLLFITALGVFITATVIRLAFIIVIFTVYKSILTARLVL